MTRGYSPLLQIKQKMGTWPTEEESFSTQSTSSSIEENENRGMSHNACWHLSFGLFSLSKPAGSLQTSRLLSSMQRYETPCLWSYYDFPLLVLVSPLRLLLSPLLDPLEYILSILVKLQLRDHDLARRYSYRRAGPIRLLFRNSFKMNDIFETVNGGDFGIAAFVGAAGYGDFVVFTDRDSANLWGRDD